MPHNEEQPRDLLLAWSDQHGPLWKLDNGDLLDPGDPLTTQDIDWLYAHRGVAGEGEQAMPWYISRCKFYVFAYLKANVIAMRRFVVWSDTPFNLARQYPRPAEHFISKIYHHHLPNVNQTQLHIEVGIESDRPLQQLQGIVSKVFNNVRQMVDFFVGDIRRWRGDNFLAEGRPVSGNHRYLEHPVGRKLAVPVH